MLSKEKKVLENGVRSHACGSTKKKTGETLQKRETQERGGGETSTQKAGAPGRASKRKKGGASSEMLIRKDVGVTLVSEPCLTREGADVGKGVNSW